MTDQKIATERIEEYLETLYHLLEGGQEISVSLVSQKLGISPPSVFEMFQKLIEEGYLKSSGRGDYQLTEEGKAKGENIVRRHRLLERLLVDVLKMDWGIAHDEACRLEHGMSQEMEDSLAKTLGNPHTCPHGNPIPGECLEAKDEIPLLELHPGEKGVIIRIIEEEREFLRYLSSLGIIPGVKIEVGEIAPFGGTRLVSVGKSRYSISDEVARKIMVRKK
ncbi:MAG: metal-dependent transcriptional regulator [Caldiserica bacterium]|jgi:DtxR family Mn-dependent transcriptional regulator|nr:metal-dependent transcriptional regulator [Caldisericota bacterium]MDH7562195.1 metal-dependent transcriptional regulator [Caldisericota bacterium]